MYNFQQAENDDDDALEMEYAQWKERQVNICMGHIACIALLFSSKESDGEMAMATQLVRTLT